VEMRHADHVVERITRSPVACLSGGRIVDAGGRARGCRSRNRQRLKMTKSLILVEAFAVLMSPRNSAVEIPDPSPNERYRRAQSPLSWNECSGSEVLSSLRVALPPPGNTTRAPSPPLSAPLGVTLPRVTPISFSSAQ
jgi:hypothetical protein